jgi:PPOX class probable F420-dependent enzyme
MTITDERYVSFTTYRKNGETVSTPVWIVALPGGRCGFTTEAGSGKTKRLGNDGRATFRPCDRGGKVADGAPETRVEATVVTEGPDLDAVREALVAKYGIQAQVLTVGRTLKRLVRMPDTSAAVIAVLPAG